MRSRFDPVQTLITVGSRIWEAGEFVTASGDRSPQWDPAKGPHAARIFCKLYYSDLV